MKDIQGFTKGGKFYKGNLHSHTTVSDGMLTPEQSIVLFKEHGYDFLSLSDHDIYTDYRNILDTEDFITLPSIEYSAVLYEDFGTKKRLKIHHLHGILGTQEMQKNAVKPIFGHMEKVPPLLFYKEWTGPVAAQQMADMLTEHGMILTYNHPIWSRVEEKEFTETKGLSMLEIFNYNTVNESNTGYDVTYWDRMLRQGKHINGFASDDNHNEGMFDDACGGWICVKAPTLTHEDIVSNILSGNYYSSSGPEIFDFGVKDGMAWVECSPCNRINFVSGNIINDGTTVLGEKFEDSLKGACNTLKGHETYVRIECTDKYGRTAWTNPLWLEW
ncbi:MAG: PHP domain-containing protein [Oscillospiraceae bacterium]